MSNCHIYNLDERALKSLRAIMLTHDICIDKNADGTVTVSFNISSKYGLSVDEDGIMVTSHLSDGDFSKYIKRSRYAFVQIS